jgi:hypothetical protein
MMLIGGIMVAAQLVTGLALWGWRAIATEHRLDQSQQTQYARLCAAKDDLLLQRLEWQLGRDLDTERSILTPPPTTTSSSLSQSESSLSSAAREKTIALL